MRPTSWSSQLALMEPDPLTLWASTSWSLTMTVGCPVMASMPMVVAC